MKRIFIILFCIISMCFYANEFTPINWQNPMLNHTTTVVYHPTSTYQPSSTFKSTSSYSYKGVYLSSQHMNGGAYSGAAGGNGFGGGFSSGSTRSSYVPQVSYSGGSFNTTYVPVSRTTSFGSTSLSDHMSVYGGDKPGIISGEENNFLDNPIIGASTYAEESLPPIICPRCSTNLGTIIIYDRGPLWFGSRYSLKGSGNFWGWLDSVFGNGEGYASLKEAKAAGEAKSNEILNEHLKTCKEQPGAPVGDISLGIFLMFLMIYYIVKKKKISKSLNFFYHLFYIILLLN